MIKNTTLILSANSNDSHGNKSIFPNVKPILVIHTGPHKTGTTYLQSILASPITRKVLLDDNYLYLGTCPVKYKNTDPCIPHRNEAFFAKKNEIVPELIYMLKKMKQERRNGLIVFEEAAYNITQLLPFIRDFDVRGTATYRRFFDWMPSAYGQVIGEYTLYMKSCFPVPPLPFHDFLFFKREDVEKECVSLYKYLWSRFYMGGRHRTMIWLELMGENGIVNTSAPPMDYHSRYDDFDGNNLLIEFFCSGAVPGTSHSCDAAKQNKLKGNIDSNARHRVDYVIMLVKAYQRKLITVKPNRNTIDTVHRMMQGVNETFLPKRCMSREKLEKLHKLSWDNEVAIFPEREGQKHVHKKSFEDFVAQDKFCSLDIDLLLEEDEWQEKIASWYR